MTTMTNDQAKSAALEWHGQAGGELLPALTANELAGLVNERVAAMIAAQPPRPWQRDLTVAPNSQDWAGMDGAIAFHLIERHSANWNDAALMMAEYLAANQVQPVQVDAALQPLSVSEQKAMLADLRGLECLIDRHDCWIVEADGRDMSECTPFHESRIAELLAVGRAMIAADPGQWHDHQTAPFKLRHGESVSAPPTPQAEGQNGQQQPV